jgi:hypothetical protein
MTSKHVSPSGELPSNSSLMLGKDLAGGGRRLVVPCSRIPSESDPAAAGGIIITA